MKNDLECMLNLKLFELKIEQKKRQLEDLKHKMSEISAVQYDAVKVKGTMPQSSVEILTALYLDLEAQIEREDAQFQEMKTRVVEKIQKLNDRRYVEVLYKKYVEYKSYEQIAEEMNYSYDHVRRIHSRAIIKLLKF